ncbi:MAG TPA: flap endonuclease [Planctomycetes bacterium]|nr:flap endonuclease [Planctomycetota bacterium]
MKVHLVDGTFELFRCFHAAPPAEAEGRQVGAVRGLLHTLAKLLRREDVSHVAVAFDGALDRRDDPGPPGQQGLALAATRALGLVVWPMVRRYEADDALATGAALYADQPGVEQVVLCTADKDLAQCVRADQVVLWDRMRGRRYDEPAVRERWGVGPASIPDYLALRGDAADGLPGLPGWGAKGAATLLARYERLEAIPPEASEWEVSVRGAERLARTLRERWHEALLYRDLIRLARDVPLPHSLAELEWPGAPRGELERFCARIGEETLLEGIPRWEQGA